MGKYKQKKELIARREILFQTIQTDPVLCKTLENAVQINDYSACASQIWSRFGNDLFGNQEPHELINDLLSWGGRSNVQPTLSPDFKRVLEIRSSKRMKNRTAKQRIIKTAGLNPNDFDRNALYASIRHHKCSRLAEPFPPPDLYISEDSTIYERNMKFVLERTLPDNRKPRKLIYELTNPSLLSHDIESSESAVFHDNNGPVAVVIRNACKNPGVINYMDKTVKKVVDTRNNVRREDGGHISQMGLSAGSLSRSMLGWVRNIRKEKSDVAKHEMINYEASSAFAVLWGLARSQLLPEIVADFDNFLEKIGPELRMDGDKTMGVDKSGRGKYKITLDEGEREFEFHNAELAPPTGVMAENYCRFVHQEKQPHEWAVSLTTSRETETRYETPFMNSGGHFYIASYGIRIQAAPNTLIAWRPSDWHGTSLFRINPSNPPDGYHQRGLCFVTGNRLVNAIKKWRETKDMIDMDATHAVPESVQEKDLDTFVNGLRRSPRLLELKKRKLLQLLAVQRAVESNTN